MVKKVLISSRFLKKIEKTPKKLKEIHKVYFNFEKGHTGKKKYV